MSPPRLLLLTTLFLSATVLNAAPEPGPGYLLRTIDGENVVAQEFALVPSPFGGWVGFFYLADEGRLVSARCSDTSCTGASSLTGPLSEQGQHVSGAYRSAINRPFAAYYDANAGALLGIDCLVSDCLYGFTRTLDDDGDVGQDTATIVDPATGRALVSYYDVGNARLKLYRCDDDGCSIGAALVVDGTAGRGRRSRMAFVGTRLWIAYEDAVAGQVRLAHAGSPYTSFTSFAVDAGAEPEVIASPGGTLELLWRDGSDNSLQRLRCLDADCASTQRGTIAGPGRGHAPTAVRTPSGQTLVAHRAPGEDLVLGTLCDDEDCEAPTLLEFASGPGLSGRAQPGVLPGDLPVAFFHDGDSAAIDASRCANSACAGFVRRVAFDGVPSGNVRVALRDGTPPVLAYIRQREPWLALCQDMACSTMSRFALPGGNSDERPALALRPDGSPFVYFASFGGSRAYDCADAMCSSGTAREVTGTGKSTSDVIELALRADGTPVLLNAVTSQARVNLFVCADVACSSGTTRQLADEADGSFLGGFGVVVGPGDRPIVLYSVYTPPQDAIQRYVRCADSACTSATVTTLANPTSLADALLALRSDGRPVFVQSPGFAPSLVTCADADCSATDTVPLPIFGGVRGLWLDEADRPVFLTTSNGTASLVRCTDAACSAVTSELLLTDNPAVTSYSGTLAMDGDGRIAAALEETLQQDIRLVLPALPDAIFANGFEP